MLLVCRLSSWLISKSIGFNSFDKISIEMFLVSFGLCVKMICYLFDHFSIRHIDGKYRNATAPLVLSGINGVSWSTKAFFCRWYNDDLLLFSDHIQNMGGRSSTQMKRFYPIFANCVHVFTDVRLRLEIFLKHLKCSSGHVECSSDNPAENVFTKNPETFCSKSKNNYNLLKNYIFFLKTFFWTRRMQFRHPCQFFLVFFRKKSWVFFSEKTWFFQNRLRWQICCRVRIKGILFNENVFSTFSGKFLQKIRKFWDLEKFQNLTKKVFF